MTATPMRESEAELDARGWPEQLAVRIARYYYELGLTQKEIADRLGIGRARVIRLLAEARERGVVSISINSPLLENESLAADLEARYGLVFAEVCLSHANDEHELAIQLAIGGGARVLSRLHDDMTIGMGWGVTLKELAVRLPVKPLNGVVVASLLGSLTRRSTITQFEATTELARRLGAECLYLPAPIICDSERSRRVLTGQALFSEIHERALSADVALVSIGGLDSATIRAAGLVSDEEFASVRRHGAIGNFLGYYIDEHAAIIDHPLNRRVIGIPGKRFQSIPERILVSAGANKLDATRAVLEQGHANALITDRDTARALLDLPTRKDASDT